MKLRSRVLPIAAAAGLALLSAFVCAQQMPANMLSETEVEALTRQLEVEDNLDIRSQLIHYYNRQQFRSPAARHTRAEHVLYLIEHHPECAIVAHMDVSLDEYLDRAAYEKGRDLWIAHTADEAATVRALDHAADFFRRSDPPRAIDLISRAATLEPENPEWPRRLGGLQLRTSTKQGSPEAKKALASFLRALEMTKGRDRYHMLIDVARAALAADAPDVARQLALEMLDPTIEGASGFNYGNAVHHGNLILGHLALDENDVEAAEQYLLRAGETPGSPSLNSFGPKMLLAKRLLAEDRRDTVIRYLELCGKFWKNGPTDKWIQVIESGETPFRPNR